jgi:release factor glutamine methyltransferase
VAALAGPVHLHAVDVDEVAVRCARRNLASVGGRVHHGDLFRPLPSGLRGMVDVLLVNAPYVPRRQIRLMPPEARLYEPAVALDGGSDGLGVLRRIAAGATQWLAPRGVLLVEISRRQAVHLVQVLAAADLAGEVVESEELAATMVRAHPRP